jgi:hypothetical protein
MSRTGVFARWQPIGHACAALVLGLFSAVPARGQAEEPIVFNRREERRTVGFDNFHGYLELRNQMENDSSSSSDGSSTKNTEYLFQQTLSLAADAFVIHPNLIDMRLAGSFGASQDFLRTDGASQTTLGPVYDYDVSATILRKEMAPVTIYSRRSESLLSREFGGTLNNAVTTYGIDWDIRWPVAPTQVRYYHTSEEQTDEAGGGVSLKLEQDAFELHSEARPADNHSLSLSYAFNNIHQTASDQTATTSVTHDLSLGHTWDFGETRRSSLASAVNFFQQSGDFPLNRIHWAEILTLHHSDAFQTHYDYTYNLEQRPGNDQQLNRGVAGFTHRLYESLVTTGDVGGSILDLSGGAQTRDLFADLNLDYHKKVPFGVLSLSPTVGFTDEQNTVRAASTAVVGEAHTFTDPNPVILSQRNIIPTSIVVRNATGLLLFSTPADYTVLVFPDHMELHRVLGGAIANGTPVLVDYLLSAQPGNSVQTFRYGAGIRYDIREGWLTGLGLYARYAQQDQSVNSSVPAAFTPDNVTETTFGADYRIWRLTFNAEHQIHESTVSPFTATRFSARYQQRLSRDASLGADVLYSIIDYSQEGNRTNFLMLSGHGEYQITPTLHGSLTLSYRNEQDQLRGDTNGFEQSADLQWKYRQLEVVLSFRNSFLNTSGGDTTTQFLMLTVRREF